MNIGNIKSKGYTMTEIEKCKLLSEKIEVFKSMTKLGIVNTKWAMKNIMGIDSKNEIRKSKISSIYE